MASPRVRSLRALVVGASLSAVVLAGCSSAAAPSSTTTGTSSQALAVHWMPSYAAPGTPATYNRVGVIRIGPSSARNVLVLEPGTSAGSAYFVPASQVDRGQDPRLAGVVGQAAENLLEDQSELKRFKQGKISSTALFNYYLGYLKDSSRSPQHFQSIPDSSVSFAKEWGMNVAVQDLHTVIGAAKRLGGKVVLGGHSLGGNVVTAYATWDFNGRPGADPAVRTRLHRWLEWAVTRSLEHWRGTTTDDGRSCDPGACRARCTEGLSVVEPSVVSPRRTRGSSTPPARPPRCSTPDRAVARPGLRSAAHRHRATRESHQRRPVRLCAQRRHVTGITRGGPRPSGDRCRPHRGRSRLGRGPGHSPRSAGSPRCSPGSACRTPTGPSGTSRSD